MKLMNFIKGGWVISEELSDI